MSNFDNLTNMQVIEKMEALIADMRADGEKLYDRNVKASAPKLRKKCQDMKALCQMARKQSLDYKNSLPTKKGGRAAADTTQDDADE